MTSPQTDFTLTNPDGTLKTPEELQEEANRIVRVAQERGARMRTALAENVVEATSKNQAATVVVTATGAVQTIRLGDRVKSMGPALIAESIMEAYHSASRQAAARTLEITMQNTRDDRVTTMMRSLLPDWAADEPGEEQQ